MLSHAILLTLCVIYNPIYLAICKNGRIKVFLLPTMKPAALGMAFIGISGIFAPCTNPKQLVDTCIIRTVYA